MSVEVGNKRRERKCRTLVGENFSIYTIVSSAHWVVLGNFFINRLIAWTVGIKCSPYIFFFVNSIPGHRSSGRQQSATGATATILLLSCGRLSCGLEENRYDPPVSRYKAGCSRFMDKDEELGCSNSGLPSIRIKDGADDGWKTLHSAGSKISHRIAQIRLVASHPEVYEPCDDSFALVDALLADRANMVDHQPKICLEIGCGSGYVITSLAIMLGHDCKDTNYIATDINPYAVETTKKTLNSHGVHAEVVCTDIASGLLKRLAHQVDVVVVNPPYVPTPEDEVGREGINAAWAGGENGRTVIDRILPVVDELLSSKGWFYMLTLAANKPAQICHVMKEKGYLSRIVVQRSTEEESLHVIKFWRNFEGGHDSSRATTPRGGGSESGFLQKFRRLSFRGRQ